MTPWQLARRAALRGTPPTPGERAQVRTRTRPPAPAREPDEQLAVVPAGALHGRLVTFMPFALDYNLGGAYNQAMARLGPDDWAVFLDHDAIWTTREWYRQLEEVARLVPDAGCVTAIQSRGWQPWQVGPYDGHDMAQHRQIGKGLLAKRTLLDVTDTSGIAGVVQLVSKRAWRLAGGYEDGMYCVDHAFHFALRAAGLRVYVHEGLYVYHWRRANHDAPPREAPRVAACPCSALHSTAPWPTRRVVLP